MAKRKKHINGDAIKSFENGINKKFTHFLAQQYDFVTHLNQELVSLGIKSKGFYSEDIDNGVQQPGHLLAKGGLLSAQPEVIAAGELLVVVSSLVRSFTKAWEFCQDDKKIKTFLFRCKCCLEIVEGVESANLDLVRHYQVNIPRQHAINMVSQGVAMSLSTRHHFAFQDHANRLKAGKHGTERFYNAVHRAILLRGKKLIDHSDDENEVCLHNSTLREFLIYCALPTNDYKNFYHSKSFRFFSKGVDTKGKSIDLREIFTDAAIIVHHDNKVTIYTPLNSKKYRVVPPIIVNDINNELGAGRVMGYYQSRSSVTLRDLGVDKDIVDRLPQSSDIISMAQQCPLYL